MREIIVEQGKKNPSYVAVAAWVSLSGGEAGVFHALSLRQGETMCGYIFDHPACRAVLPHEGIRRRFCGMCVSLACERLSPLEAYKVLRADGNRYATFVVVCGQNLAAALERSVLAGLVVAVQHKPAGEALGGAGASVHALAAAHSAKPQASGPGPALLGARALLCPEDGRPCTCAAQPFPTGGETLRALLPHEREKYQCPREH